MLIHSKLAGGLCLVGLVVSVASAQGTEIHSNALKPGAPAPALTFSHLLQVPEGTRVDWPALRGKVVVMEFWATWCAPCIGEIPVLNALAASVDPKKVQFLSVDDEDPAVVEAFLKKKSISGWIGIDTTGALYERYGVIARPTTMVFDPEGRVVSTTARPEEMKGEQLTALADGKAVTLGGDADPKMKAVMDAAMSQAISEQTGGQAGPSSALFEILLSRTDNKDSSGGRPHVMWLGPGKLEITNASALVLLEQGAGIASTRIVSEGKLPETQYNLHVDAPNTDAKELARSIELAIGSGAGLHIEHQTATREAYVLKVAPGAKDHLIQSSSQGISFFDPKTQTLRYINASLDQVASAIEKAVGMPVVNETALTGRVTLDLKVDPKDISSLSDALEKDLGLTLMRAERPIETVTISTIPPAKEPAPETTATTSQ
jgi:uncharacterized protein (TIGR03435 family)